MVHRDTYSSIVAMLLLAGAIWLLLATVAPLR